jgi:hypothetical protein
MLLPPPPVPGRIISSEMRSLQMPHQEAFFEQQAGDRLIAVLKTYDRPYAREVYGKVDNEAKKCLAVALEISKNYDPEDIPDPNGHLRLPARPRGLSPVAFSMRQPPRVQ